LGQLEGPFCVPLPDLVLTWFENFELAPLVTMPYLRLLNSQGVLIDQVNWGQFPRGSDQFVSSMQLDPTFLDATSNDELGNWCRSYVAIADTQWFGTPGVVNDCTEYEVDTDGGGDTDPPPLVYRAWTQFLGPVAPGSYFIGDYDRIGALFTIGEGTDDYDADCALAYTFRATSIIRGASLCVDCEFGFEVDITYRTDILPTLGRPPSDCSTAMASAWGGNTTNVPNIRVAYHPINGEVLYQVGSVWSLYTEDVERTPGFIRFERQLFINYYY
jgi:hypothetical protein